MKIIEFFGGPGSGKTTSATHCFSAFKRRGIECEFTREYAQEAIFAQQTYQLAHQVIVAANQYRKYTELQDAGHKLVFSDSSILLSKIYGAGSPKHDLLLPILDALHGDFEVIKVFVTRSDRPFSQRGRVHTEGQSRELDILIKSRCGPFHYVVDSNIESLNSFVDLLEKDLYDY